MTRLLLLAVANYPLKTLISTLNMSATPESVQTLLNSDNFGDRLSGINQLRQLDPATAFELIRPAVTDKNVRVRYAAVSQLSSLGKTR